MDPDQTAPVIEASETFQQTRKADDFCCDWGFKGYYPIRLQKVVVAPKILGS